MNQKLAIGLKYAETLLLKWGATHEQIQVILPTEEGNLEIRISHILNIHTALRAIFSNEDNVYGFMSHTNNNTFFNGRSPTSIIASGRLSDLQEVREKIESLVLS
ncbi:MULTISPECIES: hypothetical protein [Vibrio]|uniref:DUF2384 domain-containing protein n=1 Tax=Vibrio gallaecicus TaxID=552386 RepID=A0ABV4NFS2_9VIBR|nr:MULTISPECIES: hypothetical protein [Vibrio]MBT2915480.1 DUF2384 domain-containing protein [Vibrio anguillarum]OQQ10749.1 hypothetical protein BK410_11450 [Vibrio anguillarum]PMG22739.1 hypothetical protein BCU95_16055 [Vibrio splendidus]PMI76519.1 hypothetical protein BCU38_06055 [Vibrio splendidus]CDT48957.1 conserved hypothetical protein [Vibrio coralliirubri]